MSLSLCLGLFPCVSFSVCLCLSLSQLLNLTFTFWIQTHKKVQKNVIYWDKTQHENFRGNRVGGQLRGGKECPFTDVTTSGRVSRKVPESDQRSECAYAADDFGVTVRLLTTPPLRRPPPPPNHPFPPHPLPRLHYSAAASFS